MLRLAAASDCTLIHPGLKCNPDIQINKFIAGIVNIRYSAFMITKNQLITYLGGTPSKAAARLGYKGQRPDNSINKFDDPLTETQAAAVMLRMRAKRIKVPKEWLS